MESEISSTNRVTGARGSLFAGGVAALLASACCLGPLVLLALGFSGAWIANLSLLEPYRPLFISAALLALGGGASGVRWRRASLVRPVLFPVSVVATKRCLWCSARWC